MPLSVGKEYRVSYYSLSGLATITRLNYSLVTISVLGFILFCFISSIMTTGFMHVRCDGDMLIHSILAS